MPDHRVLAIAGKGRPHWLLQQGEIQAPPMDAVSLSFLTIAVKSWGGSALVARMASPIV
jgi:hypothetical protein